MITKSFQSFLGVLELAELMRRVRVGRRGFAAALAFHALAAVFEALNILVMALLVRGCIYQSFSFAGSYEFLNRVLGVLPESVRSRHAGLLVFLLAAIIITTLLKNAMSYLGNVSLVHQGSLFDRDLRALIMKRYMTFGKPYFDHLGAAKLHHDIELSSHVGDIISRLGKAMLALILFPVYAVILFIVSPELTLGLMMALPVFILVTGGVIRGLKGSSRSLTDSAEKASVKIANILYGMPLIKACGNEEREAAEYDAACDSVRRDTLKISRKNALVEPLQEVMTTGMLVLLVIAVSLMVVERGAKDVSIYLVYLYVLRRFLMSAREFGLFGEKMASVSGALTNIARILDDGEKYEVPDGSLEFDRLSDSIEFRGLNFGYHPSHPVVRDFNVRVRKGEVTAIVGPTGCGKSTLIQLLLRFYDCPPGSIFVDGIDIRSLRIQSWRRCVAWVGQETWIFEDTIRNNILYGLDRVVSADELEEVLQKSRLSELIRRLPHGLDTRVGDRGVKLSGGEKQRIAIARAILKRADILLLDEATSALDSVTESKVREALSELVDGQTVIMIAHRPSTIRHADRIVHMDAGSVIEQRSNDEHPARLIGS